MTDPEPEPTFVKTGLRNCCFHVPHIHTLRVGAGGGSQGLGHAAKCATLILRQPLWSLKACHCEAGWVQAILSAWKTKNLVKNIECPWFVTWTWVSHLENASEFPGGSGTRLPGSFLTSLQMMQHCLGTFSVTAFIVLTYVILQPFDSKPPDLRVYFSRPGVHSNVLHSDANSANSHLQDWNVTTMKRQAPGWQEDCEL
jgi:hypothetical protein